jgi:aminopeptidase
MHPPQSIIENYASVLVNFALNGGKGIRKGEVVYLQVPECAKPMLKELQIAVLKAGGHFITQFVPDDLARTFYEHANDHQIDFFPERYLKGRVEQVDHYLSILAETNKHELKGVDPQKIMRRDHVFKPYWDWREEKENTGKLTWTLGLYGTEAMAKEAGLTIEEYWDQIIHACFLDQKDPIGKWKESMAEIERVKHRLNELHLQKVRVLSEGTDLTVGLGPGRKWMGGSGRNIPSFELFISPDARMTEGHITLNQPLYRYGNLIKGIYLEFKNGKVVHATAHEGQDLLREMIVTPGADRIGEFSMTDSRLSKITKFMAETLFDENIGGEQGNTHIALGAAYKDSYPGDASKLSEEEWEALGYNDSSVHTDVISTSKRTIIGTLKDGSEKVIYENGMFTF